MINATACHVVLTSRSGSDRLPNKNMMECAGYPLMYWVTKECFRSWFVDSVFHISDSEEHRDYMAGLGCATIEEPSDVAAGNVPILSVLKHAVQHIKCQPKDYIIWVDVSKPLTRCYHIEKCIRNAYYGGYDSVFTTKKLRYNLIGDAAVVSQEKPKHETRFMYFGAVRLRTRETIENATDGTWGYGERHLDLPICEDHEIDVDYLHDLIMAEALIRAGY